MLPFAACEDAVPMIHLEEPSSEADCELYSIKSDELNIFKNTKIKVFTLELHHVNVREVMHKHWNIGIKGLPLFICHC